MHSLSFYPPRFLCMCCRQTLGEPAPIGAEVERATKCFTEINALLLHLNSAQEGGKALVSKISQEKNVAHLRKKKKKVCIMKSFRFGKVL